MSKVVDYPFAHWSQSDHDALWCALFAGQVNGVNTTRNRGTIIRHYCDVSERAKMRMAYGMRTRKQRTKAYD